MVLRFIKKFNIIFLATYLTCSSQVYANNNKVGHIALVRGQVFILDAKTKAVIADPEGKRGRNTQKDSPFFEGEIIQTREGARVKLVFDEGNNEVVLGSGTSLIIDRAGSNKSGTELSLNNGSVRSIVNRKYSGEDGDVFEIKTPNSVAGVRGTVFNVLFDSKKGTTQIFTERGAVSISNITAGRRATTPPVQLEAGKFSEVNKDQAPTPPRNYDVSQPNILSEPVDAPTESNATEEGGAEGSLGTPRTDISSSKDSTNNEAPAVAIAPKSVNTLDSDSDRAPASTNDTELSAQPLPKIITSGSSSGNTSSAVNPFDLVNQQSDAMRRQAEEELRRKRLIEGNLSEIGLKIQ